MPGGSVAGGGTRYNHRTPGGSGGLAAGLPKRKRKGVNVVKKARKTSILVIATAIVATIGLASSGPSAQTEGLRIGVVDQDRILNESEEGKRLRADLEKLRDAKATEIESLETEIKALQEQLQNAQMSMSNDRQQDISRQLKKKRVEYERVNEDASAEFQEAANRAQLRLVSMFRELIRQYGAQQGYTAIFEANTLYYSADAVDVTDDLLGRFNEYTKTAAAK